MKKIYLLLTLMIFMSSCEKEEVFEIQNESSIMHFSTVPQKAAIDFLKSVKKSNSHKQSEIIIHYDQLHYDTINNSTELLTVIPAQSKFAEVDSRVLVLEVDGNIEPVLFNLVPEIQNNDTLFTGKIIISNLDLKFITGFRVKNGNFISQFVKKENLEKSNKCQDGYWEGIDMDCHQNLDEVVLMGSSPTPYISITHIYPNSGGGYDDGYSWDYPSRSDGGGGTTTPIPDEETIKIVNNLSDPCASLIFRQMHLAALNTRLPKSFTEPNDPSVQHSLSEGIINLFNNSLTYDYVIKNAALINKNASTIGATTTLDSNYLKVATQLSIARTIIHEMLHAYLNLTITNSPQIGNKNFYEQMMDFARINGFHPSGSETERNTFQHEFMGGYVDAMAYSLYRWDQNHGTRTNLGRDYYFNLASAGLLYKDANGNYQYTDSFKNLFKDDEDGVTAAQKQNEAKNY